MVSKHSAIEILPGNRILKPAGDRMKKLTVPNDPKFDDCAFSNYRQSTPEDLAKLLIQGDLLAEFRLFFWDWRRPYGIMSK